MTTKQYNICVNNFSDNVYRFILKSVKRADTAQDIVQDSFEKMWINKSSVSFEKAKSYLFTTAYRSMIDLIRREKKMFSTEDEQITEPSHTKQFSDINDVLRNAVDKLPKVQRSVVLLRDYEGYSYKEIAEITELSEQQVKVYIYRARVFLKSYIGRVENVI